jgi:hypothetical protein
MVIEQPVNQSSTPSTPLPTYTDNPPEEVDPVISRLSQFLDDF